MTDIDLTVAIRDAIGIEGLAQLYHIRNILSAMTPLDYLIFDVYEEGQSQINLRSIVVSDRDAEAQSEMIMIDLTLITAEVNFSIDGVEIPASRDLQYLLRSLPEEILDVILRYLEHRIAIIKWEIECAYKCY